MWHFAEFEPSTEDWKLILSSGFIAGAHELLILRCDFDKGWEHVREILDEDMLTERSISVDKFTIRILIICTLNFGDKIFFIHIDQAQPSVFLVKLFQAEVIEDEFAILGFSLHSFNNSINNILKNYLEQGNLN